MAHPNARLVVNVEQEKKNASKQSTTIQLLFRLHLSFFEFARLLIVPLIFLMSATSFYCSALVNAAVVGEEGACGDGVSMSKCCTSEVVFPLRRGCSPSLLYIFFSYPSASSTIHPIHARPLRALVAFYGVFLIVVV